MVSYPHFLKISFKLIKWGLSYSLKRDPRPFSKSTKVAPFYPLSMALTASKNAFWRLLLINWTFNWGQFHLSIKIEFPDNQWQPPKLIFGGCQWIKWCNFCTFWEWPRITFSLWIKWTTTQSEMSQNKWNNIKCGFAKTGKESVKEKKIGWHPSQKMEFYFKFT